MSNMSYCKFSNTLLDLRDCVETLQENDNLGDMDLSEDELTSLKYMYNLCERFMDNVDRLKEEDYE